MNKRRVSSMEVSLESGRYIVAVSGGVDSMALLTILAKQKYANENQAHLQLIVAHFDHGIRVDSSDDRKFVQAAARHYNLPFVYDTADLGEHASEAKARKARYDFLRTVKSASNADAILTAHHADDMLETAIINILRGTGRRGLSSLSDTDDIQRPLLSYSKTQILDYAKHNGIQWHEDSTNEDTKYLRNYVRHKIISKFSDQERQQFFDHIEKIRVLNQDIDHALINHLHIHPAKDILDRHWFIMLPHAVARDTLAGWLRLRGAAGSVDKKMLEKLVVSAKTLLPGKRVDIDGKRFLLISNTQISLINRVST